MFIYVDNNILIDYEEGKKELPLSPEINYVYSYVHIQELQEFKKGFDTKKNGRLKIIEDLTSCWYVSNNGNHLLVIDKANPFKILAYLETPKAKAFSQTIHDGAYDLRIDDFSTYLTNKLNIEKKVINNYTPDKLFEDYGNQMRNYVGLTCNSRQEAFLSLFNILDSLGFWKDTVRPGSTMNRLYDANHAYFATACTYFVTNDNNTRKKANVCDRLFGIKTKAINYDEFICLNKNSGKMNV